MLNKSPIAFIKRSIGIESTISRRLDAKSPWLYALLPLHNTIMARAADSPDAIKLRASGMPTRYISNPGDKPGCCCRNENFAQKTCPSGSCCWIEIVPLSDVEGAML